MRISFRQIGYAALLLALLWSGCQKAPPAPRALDAVALVDGLPLLEPAVTAARIRAVHADEHQLNFIYQHLLYRSIDRLPAATLLGHLHYYEQALPENKNALAFVRYMRGELYLDSGQLDSALAVLAESRSLYQTLRDSMMEGDVWRKMGAVYTSKGDYPAASEHYLRGLECYEGSTDQKKHAMAYFDLGISYRNQENWHQSRAAFEACRAIGARLKDGYTIALGLEGVTMTLIGTEHLDSARLLAQQTHQMVLQSGYTDQLPSSARLLGMACARQGDYGLGLYYLRLSDSLLTGTGAINYLPRIWLEEGRCYAGLGQYAVADSVYKRALDAPSRRDDLPFRMTVHEALSSLCAKTGQFQNALNHLRTSHEISDILKKREQDQLLNQLHVQYETAQQDKLIQNLQHSNKTAHLYALSALCTLAAVIASFLLLVYRQRQNQRYLRARNDLLAAREQSAQIELEAHREKLKIFTENLLAKNRIISDLEAGIPHGITRSGASEVTGPQPDEDGLVRMKILTEEDWQNYQRFFNHAHPGFVQRIKGRFGDLTAAELRLFMLIKQGFPSKEIAELLGISMPGVKKNRYRLRKKIGLEEGDNLEEFIQQF